MKIKHIATALLLAGLSIGASAEVTEGKDYKVLSKPIPQLQKDKIEVTEFFGYFCVHCYDLEPVIQKHAKTWASDVYLRPIHVVWQDEMMGLARVAAAVNSSGLKESANMPIFYAVYKQGLNLADDGIFTQWAQKQTDFDGKKLLAAYTSFSNQNQAKQMADLTAEFSIDGTPTVIIGGKYQMIFTSGESWDSRMNKVGELITKVRQERGMTAPVTKTSTSRTGRAGSIAKLANQ